MTTPQKQWQDLQEQNLEMLKAQQEAYLAGIKAWQTQLAASTEAASQTPQQVPSFPQFAIPQVPTFPQAPTPAAFPAFPTAEEIAEINRVYLAEITEQQQEFMRRLSTLNNPQT